MRALTVQEEQERADPRLARERQHRDTLRQQARLALGEKVPYNAEVEQALLGALLRSNSAYDRVSFLQPVHFYIPEHIAVFKMIQEHIEAGKDASPATLSHLAENEAVCKGAGGTAYLYELATNVVTIVNAGDYARTIHDLYLRRELIGHAEDLAADAYDETLQLDRPATSLIEDTADRLAGMMDEVHGQGQSTLLTAAEAAERYMEAAEKARVGTPPGLLVALSDLDGLLHGFGNARVYILAGTTGMGKTLTALHLARRLAISLSRRDAEGAEIRGRGHVLFFSLEMGAQELASRLFSSMGRIDTARALHGKSDQADFDAMADVRDQLKSIPLVFEERASQTMAYIRSTARTFRRRRGLGAIVIDYLQIIEASAQARSYRNRYLEISELTRQVKQLSRELDIPIILLAQLNRELMKREDKRPQLSDLRDSGSIEQDADVVMLLHRPEYYLQRETPEQRPNEDTAAFLDRQLRHEGMLNEKRNIMEIIVAKNRHGATGTVELFCDTSKMLIDDLVHGGGPNV